ncbi:hypothetical protein SARC_03548 [Sphaeroforma arctica JP610]|uniref:Uncharacterized protein n=1 Tax=Sphaeroforma arctica JP610 TaxID=667725 RepID=A0A0L0G5V2_9EUKA|nr:hypothetical protein SARC_03548 [Sphaeroforma arctica JP610]KNC84216.1 hypothetical protein SARC_03548 [Sphaeroforma arctica JP610]|eukprot:XP_014158118.1 hypothetical protein SARC_03548 [Sphaeroforma arctica JP610]
MGLKRWCILDRANMPSEEELGVHICFAWRMTIQCPIDERDRHKIRFIASDGQVYERVGADFSLAVVPAQNTTNNEYNFRTVEDFLCFVDGSAMCTKKEDDQLYEPQAGVERRLTDSPASKQLLPMLTDLAVPTSFPKSFYTQLWYDGFVTISEERMQGIVSLGIPKNKDEPLTTMGE